jgi:hypothetical protein
MKTLLLITLFLLAGCQNTLTILDGATHACGTIHVEGYFTDSEGEVRVMKLPTEWTAEEVNAFCPQ